MGDIRQLLFQRSYVSYDNFPPKIRKALQDAEFNPNTDAFNRLLNSNYSESVILDAIEWENEQVRLNPASGRTYEYPRYISPVRPHPIYGSRYNSDFKPKRKSIIQKAFGWFKGKVS